MKLIADLHIHSKYSRATSKDMDLEHLLPFAKLKGMNVLGTSDFTHPIWFSELKQKLVPNGQGLYNIGDNISSAQPNQEPKDIFFMLTSEISLMYSQDGKGRRVHLVLLAPDFQVVEQITEYLKTKGRVDYDGRPIFGIPAPELTESLMQISREIMIIPAHIWTPWFGLLGSKSGFNSIEEAFQDQSKHIYALETGLSSDPEMNWRLSSLDKYTLVSFSDSHSFWPWRLGREAIILQANPSYREIIEKIKNKKLEMTIEVDPNYGKYHWDGHRNCNISLSPEESAKTKGICPICKKPLTIGVLNRVEELADRPEGFIPNNPIPFKKIIPLSELLANLYNTQPSTKKIQILSSKLMQELGPELSILLESTPTSIEKFSNQKVAELIIKNRSGQLQINPGYDGVYGTLKLENSQKSTQKGLISF